MDEKEGGYDGDFTRVLDYLRGTVFISVDLATSSEALKTKYDKVISDLERKIGRVQRVKLFRMEGLKSPPRILINLLFDRNSRGVSLICEVQVRFALYGFDFEFQNFLHAVYELERKPMVHINWKPHVFGLTRDMLSKTGISLDDNMVETWVKVANFVKIDYVRGNYEDEDELKIILVKNKGTRHEKSKELRYRVEYIIDNQGTLLTVEGKEDQYQFQIRPHNEEIKDNS
jgi:hypothetical protein